MPGSCQAITKKSTGGHHKWIALFIENLSSLVYHSILYQNLAGSLTLVEHWVFGSEQISLYDDFEKQNLIGCLISCNAASFSQIVGSFCSLQDQPACRHSLPTEFERNCYNLLNIIDFYIIFTSFDTTSKEMIEKKWTIPGNFKFFPGNSSLPLIPTLNSSLTFTKAMSTCE